MTDKIKKIKKVNSLDELDKLKIGNFVKIKDYAEDEGLIFEEKTGEEYRFMEIKFPVIWSNRINKWAVNFENGMIKVEKGKLKLEVYDVTDNCYQEKLNICKMAGVI